MPIDILLFNGGLKMAGKATKKVGGVQYYGIDEYRDLNNLLGNNWHVRGLNSHGDYGYAIKNTVQFYVKKYRPLTEYIPSSCGTISRCKLNMYAFLLHKVTAMPAHLERTVTYFVNVILSLGYTVQVMYCQYKLYTYIVCDIQ